MGIVSKVTLDGGTTKNLIASTFYGRCTTASGTAAKTVTIGGWSENDLATVLGTTVHINFTTGNTASNPTLSIDSSTAHAILKDEPVSSTSSTLNFAGNFGAGIYELTLIERTYNGVETRFWLMGGKATSVDWDNVSNKPSTFPPTTGSTSTTAAAGNHGHGNMDNYGAITPTATIASGDRLVIADQSDGYTATGSSIAFGSDSGKYLSNSGTWEDVAFKWVPDGQGNNTDGAYYYSTTISYADVLAANMAGKSMIIVASNNNVLRITGSIEETATIGGVSGNYVYWLCSTVGTENAATVIFIGDYNDTTNQTGSRFYIYKFSKEVGEAFPGVIPSTTGNYVLYSNSGVGGSWSTINIPITAPTTSGTYSLNVPSSGDPSWTAVAPSGLQPPSENGHFMLGVSGSSVTWESCPDLNAIEALTPTVGLLKKTAANTWTLDNTTYATSANITSAIQALDGSITGTPGASKAITAFSETDGVVSATFGDISITKSQVSDFPSSMPASDVSAWAKASTKPTYSLSEISGTSDLQAIEGLTGTSGLLKKTAADTWSLDTTTYLPTTGGDVTGDVTLLKQVESGAPGDSYALIFQRGTLTDSYNDWMIVDSGGYLYFKERGSGSTAWTTRVNFNTTGGVIATGQVQGNSLASSSFLTLGSTCTIASGDQVLVADSSDSDRIKRSTLAFGSDPSTYLGNDGTWKSPIKQLFGKCSTGASTAAKTVSIDGFTTDANSISDMSGMTIFVAMSSANTAASPTLNVNSTGAYPIMSGTYQDPTAVGKISAGVHAFTLVRPQTAGSTYYWFINEGADTVPEAPTTNGTYILTINGTSAVWSTFTPPAAATVGTLTLTTSWSGSGPYSQTVTISGSTANSKIDLQPDSTVLAQMTTDGTTAIYIENNNGTLTAWAMGAAPTASLTIQYTKTEVA